MFPLHLAINPWRWPSRWVHLGILVVLVVWTWLECFGPLPAKSIAASTFDQMQQRRLWASAPDPRIVIVDIDERSLAELAGEFGRWPWPRDTIATVLEDAQQHGAAAVVFDILFSDPDKAHPGGDQALDAAVRESSVGLFPVVRLPARLDAESRVRVDQLPGLALGPAPTSRGPTVAVVLPFMRAMLDSGRLGTNTVNLDSDGKIRRFGLYEALADGWWLRSMPAAVASLLGAARQPDGEQRLIVWRREPNAYPRVPFSVAWQCAEAVRAQGCPDWHGRILIVGSTAASLHDIKTTPLAADHAGVDVLATVIDDALHGRSLRELPVIARWLMAVAALLFAFRVVRRGRADSTSRALWVLPTVLLAIGFASLHSEQFYVDLTVPAAAALTFLSAVKLHDSFRGRHFGLGLLQDTGRLAVVCGGPSGHAELIERTVFDVAARSSLTVSGISSVCGASGAAHSAWAIWSVPDAQTAGHIQDELARALPESWCNTFEVGEHAYGSLLAAVAREVAAVPTRDAK